MGKKFKKFADKMKTNAQKNAQKRRDTKIARKKGEQSAPNSQELINNNGDSDNSGYGALDTLSTTASHVYSHKGKYAIGLGVGAISSVACSGLCVLCVVVICFALSLYYYINKHKSSKKK